MVLQTLTPQTVPGDSPVKQVPVDYYPTGDGFGFTIQSGLDAGKKIFLRDSRYGQATPQGTIVFIHGNPESSYTFRHVIQLLVMRSTCPFRVVAMDHMGFGLSDTAAGEMVCMDHAENLGQLIRYLDLDQITLVVHDWGGPIGIGAFLEEPERVSGLVLLNSTVFPMPLTGLTYRNYPIAWLAWSKTPYIIPNRYWGAFSSYAIFRTRANPGVILIQMIRYIREAESGRFPQREHAAHKIFCQQFQCESNVKSSKRLVRQSALWGHGNAVFDAIRGRRDTKPFYRYIQENLKNKWGPDGGNIKTRGVFGAWDPLAKDDVIAQWTENLPQLDGRVKRFTNAGHFIEETHPGEVADAILDVAGLR
jgi:pimeloyl-ACP methyl ester carboxylesterase